MNRYIYMCMFLLFPLSAGAQYYDWGQDPASTRWNVIKLDGNGAAHQGQNGLGSGKRGFKIIYPRGQECLAARYANLFDTLRKPVGFGFRHGAMGRTPVVLHTQNFQSNGIVMLAPRRMELITTPDARQFAFPSHKQLAAHEMRHAVQYNNLNRGVIRALTWPLGQQGALLGMAFMPVWAMEGDAVMAETMMAERGRGVQPSFSIEYRAMLAEGIPRAHRAFKLKTAGAGMDVGGTGTAGGERTLKSWRKVPIDEFFSGSYKDYMPDHYRVGYQIMSWAWRNWDEVFLDKTSDFAARRPWTIAPFSIALKKYYGTTTGRMFRSAFDEMEERWRDASLMENSSTIIETPITSHTRYESPRWRWDNGNIIALKTDLDRTTRLVQIDPNGNETVLCRTGLVNSPLAVNGARIYWTELRQSIFWQQRVGSVICFYDLKTGRKGVWNRSIRDAMFPTTTETGLRWVEYASGEYIIKYNHKAFRGINQRYSVPDSISVHGLATTGDTSYYIGLDDAGMWIGSDNRRVTEPTHATLSDLIYSDSTLYFTSTASGKDEAHALDLRTGRERRITNSRYGSFSPSPTPDGVVMTTYTPFGWMLARQSRGGRDYPLDEVSLSPTMKRWDVPNLDQIATKSTTGHPSKKYRKGANLFNFHSWAPLYFEPDKVVDEVRFDLVAGVTAMSQNALNNTYTELGWGFTRSDGSSAGGHGVAHAKFKWMGWAPKFELTARWSGVPQNVQYEGFRPANTAKLRDHLQFDAFACLPALLSSGAALRWLTPSMQLQHTNTLFYHIDGTHKTGINIATAAVQYTEQQRLAHRDFAPPFGYSVRVSRSWGAFNHDFGRILTVNGRLWLPGVALHHSLLLQGAAQWQQTRKYVMQQKVLYPRGATYRGVYARRYHAYSVDYALPLAYPDWGINSLLFIRRIRIAPGYDEARFVGFNDTRWRTVRSCGADLIFDVSALRLPTAGSVEATFSLRRPSDTKKLWFNFGLAVSF